MLSNVPWWLLIGAALCSNLFNTVRGATAAYFFKDYIGDSIFLNLGDFTICLLYTSAMPTMNVETGILTLHMANGETVEIPKLTINAPEFCYIPVLPGEGTELKGGEVFDIQVENGDKLTGVQVNGQNVQSIVSANSCLLYTSRCV